MSASVEPLVAETPVAAPGALATPGRQALRRFMEHRLAVAGVVVMVVVILVAILAPVVAGQSPTQTSLDAISRAPGGGHLLGTDDAGRDVWARLIYGARTSLAVGFGAVAITLVIGVVVGVAAGYIGGWVDQALMRVTDAFMSFPPLLLAIVFVAIAGPSLTSVMIVIAAAAWPTGARVIRAQVLSLKQQDFVTAAGVIGARGPGIVRRHLLPNLLGQLSVVATFGVASAILTEASLGFLGLGVRPPTASWGQMINAAQSPVVLLSEPWLWIPPSVAICVTVLAVNFVGDGLRHAVDPQGEGRRGGGW